MQKNRTFIVFYTLIVAFIWPSSLQTKGEGELIAGRGHGPAQEAHRRPQGQQLIGLGKEGAFDTDSGLSSKKGQGEPSKATGQPPSELKEPLTKMQENSSPPITLPDPEQSSADPEQSISWSPKFDPNKAITFAIHVLFAISGIYVTFMGLKSFRLTMVILGFYVSFYTLLFILTESKIYKTDCIPQQLGLFFACVFLGFILSIITYIFERVNFLLMGCATASVISLFAAQFLIDFQVSQDRLIFGLVQSSAMVTFVVCAFYFTDHFLIWSSAFVGAIIAPINIGVVFGDFSSFEDRRNLPADRWSDLRVYLFVCGMMFLKGLVCQYFIRRRILKSLEGKGDSLLCVPEADLLN